MPCFSLQDCQHQKPLKTYKANTEENCIKFVSSCTLNKQKKVFIGWLNSNTNKGGGEENQDTETSCMAVVTH